MTYKIEYQYSAWEGRDDSDGSWWIESERAFKSKGARTRKLNELNKKYEFTKFREKGMIEKIVVYTDGSSNWKDRTGGVGIYMKFGKHKKRVSKGFSNTTNNRMELMAVIEALRAITVKDKYETHIYTDSEYVVNIVTKWAVEWEKEDFFGKKNVDLLVILLEEYRLFPLGKIIVHWVKGHNGVEGNEIADTLADKGRRSSKLIRDCKDELQTTNK